jgi:hypothetical protein
MKLTGENRRTRGKTRPSATLSITNTTWTDPGSNPGLRGGRPAVNRLSHGTATFKVLTSNTSTVSPLYTHSTLQMLKCFLSAKNCTQSDIVSVITGRIQSLRIVSAAG